MEFYTKKKEDSKWNPKNRFLLIFCHTSSVDDGWGFKCCNCRMFPFSMGVYIFSAIMLINAIKDLYDITLSDYLVDEKKKSEKDILFLKFFYVKVGADVGIILGILAALYSVCAFHSCSSILAYYIVAIAFILNTSFCIYVATRFTDLSFWWKIELKIMSVVLWFFFDSVLLLFDWILFCNMVDIKRKKDKLAQDNVFNFGF